MAPEEHQDEESGQQCGESGRFEVSLGEHAESGSLALASHSVAGVEDNTGAAQLPENAPESGSAAASAGENPEAAQPTESAPQAGGAAAGAEQYPEVTQLIESAPKPESAATGVSMAAAVANNAYGLLQVLNAMLVIPVTHIDAPVIFRSERGA